MVKVWDLRKDKTPVYTHRCSASVNRLSVSPSGASIAVPLDNRHTKICELMGSRGGQLNSHEPEGHRMAITSTVWAADESIVYTSSFDRYRSVLAWSFSESKEDQREAREAAALAKKVRRLLFDHELTCTRSSLLLQPIGKRSESKKRQRMRFGSRRRKRVRLLARSRGSANVRRSKRRSCRRNRRRRRRRRNQLSNWDGHYLARVSTVLRRF